MFRKFLLFIVLFTFLVSQDEVCLPKNDFDFLANELRQLEVSDSLKTLELEELNKQLLLYVELSKNDSLHIAKLTELLWTEEQKYKLCSERLEEVEPGFFDNKYLWFLFGIFSKHGIENIGN
tara:strand:+ start:191 stop:556 length:366 start_codon:yes stop_codon:yes gene_type:complete